MQGIMHHVRVQVTGAAGGNLDSGYPVGANPVSIVLGFEITLDDGNGEFIFQGIDGGLEQAGLAGTG